jgi:type II secretory pathway component PulM
MRDEDEIIQDYEEEFEPARRSNRGFWLVAGALLVVCVVVFVAILANRPLGNSIAHAESTLRDAQAAATTVHDGSGSYADADVAALASADPTNTYLSGDVASTGLDEVSIANGSGEWAAAVQARPGACFYLHLTDAGETFYGVGTDCTGRTALAASDPRW